MPYKFDAFISYRRRSPVLDWVRNHFKPKLEQWLPVFMAKQTRRKVRIAIDSEIIETGDAWLPRLRESLRVSRCMVAIWSPEYFRSHWCMAELKSMIERERVLGLQSDNMPWGLVYPICYVKKDFLRSEYEKKQRKDLHRWNTPDLIFQATPEYVAFDREMQELCQELASMIGKAPRWKADWPILEPEVRPELKFGLPNVGESRRRGRP